jgi:hypothetical protein
MCGVVVQQRSIFMSKPSFPTLNCSNIRKHRLSSAPGNGAFSFFGDAITSRTSVIPAAFVLADFQPYLSKALNTISQPFQMK